MFIKKQLLLISALTCICSLSAMDEFNHSMILEMIKNGKLQVHDSVKLNQKLYILASSNITEGEDDFSYALKRPATFGYLNLGYDFLTTEGSLSNNKKATTKEERIYNNTTRYFGNGLLGTSLLAGSLVFIFGFVSALKRIHS